MTIYVANAFSLSMLPEVPDYSGFDIRVVPVDAAHVVDACEAHKGEVVSCVGHANTAAVMTAELGGLKIPVNRVSVELRAGDLMFVGQYSGPRLEEGATELPEGASIRWMRVSILAPHGDN